MFAMGSHFPACKTFLQLCTSLPLPLYPSWFQGLGLAVATTSFLDVDVSFCQPVWASNNYKIPAKNKIDTACVGIAGVAGWTQPLSLWAGQPDSNTILARGSGPQGQQGLRKRFPHSGWSVTNTSQRKPLLASFSIHLPPLSKKSQRWVPPTRRGQNSVWFCEQICKIMLHHTQRRNQVEKPRKHTIRASLFLLNFISVVKLPVL